MDIVGNEIQGKLMTLLNKNFAFSNDLVSSIDSDESYIENTYDFV
jgi:hypothetical protein